MDKTHRIGPVYSTQNGDRQDVIVRMKSHSARYAIYNKRKNSKNNNIRIKPSLTEKRRKLLTEAYKKYENNEKVHFVFCDEHGDLKVRLNSPVNRKYVYRFKTINDIDELIDKLDISDGEE